MATKPKNKPLAKKDDGFIIGLEESSHISRIEGLILTKEMRAMFSSFDKKRISPDARRKIIFTMFAQKAS
jgi:hypothetical protein